MHFSLRISSGKHTGREIPIPGPRFIIGCADDCHLKIPATQVSLYHCALLIQDDGIWARNYGSGIIVGGARIVDRRRLKHGDQLQIGSLHFELLIEDAPVKGNDRVPDEGKTPDVVSQPVERPVAPVPELSDLSSERPVAPAAGPSELSNARSELLRVPPKLDTIPALLPDPAAEVASETLDKFFTCKNAHNARVVAPAAITPPPRRRSPWLLIGDGQLNPNVMFALGILVGIGLCSAASAFLTISGQPAATAPAAAATAPAAIVDDEIDQETEQEVDQVDQSLATTREEGISRPEE